MSFWRVGNHWLQELKPLALSDTEEHAKKRLGTHGTHGAVTHHWGRKTFTGDNWWSIWASGNLGLDLR